MDSNQILSLPMSPDADAGPTVRDYLRVTFQTFLQEGEGFSGKRPLGNSDWDYQLAAALIKGGAIRGQLDEYEDPEEFEWKDYNDVMTMVVAEVFKTP